MFVRPSSLIIAAIASLVVQPAGRSTIAERVLKLGRDARWQPVAVIAVNFPTYHPQGMVKIGDTFFVSSVEVRVPPVRFASPMDGYDRETGQGAGHLFKIDAAGQLVRDVPLGEGTIYHPGGIDFDGTNIWVPVAEYRPDSRSINSRSMPPPCSARKAGRRRPFRTATRARRIRRAPRTDRRRPTRACSRRLM